MKYLEEVGKTVQQVYWILIVKGALLLVLAVLIALYPPLLVALVIVGLMIFGVLLWVMAYKVHRLWRKIPNFMK